MEHPAAVRDAVDNPFDDIHAIRSTANTPDPPSTHAPANTRGDTQATGVPSRRCHSICVKLHKLFYPAHNGRYPPPDLFIWLMCLIVACFCVATSTLHSYKALTFIPLVLMGAAILFSLAAFGQFAHLTMPLCIASYVAVFVITITSYLLDEETKLGQRTTLIVIMSAWCAFIPVVCFLAWSFWKPRTREVGRGNRQLRQRAPSQPAIELARLPRAPLPAVLHPPQQLRPGASVNHSRAGWESRSLSSASDEGFQRVRDFV